MWISETSGVIVADSWSVLVPIVPPRFGRGPFSDQRILIPTVIPNQNESRAILKGTRQEEGKEFQESFIFFLARNLAAILRRTFRSGYHNQFWMDLSSLFLISLLFIYLFWVLFLEMHFPAEESCSACLRSTSILMNGSRGTRIGWNPGRTVIPSMILSKNAGIIMTIRRSPRRRNSSLRHKIEKKNDNNKWKEERASGTLVKAEEEGEEEEEEEEERKESLLARKNVEDDVSESGSSPERTDFVDFLWPLIIDDVWFVRWELPLLSVSSFLGKCCQDYHRCTIQELEED